MFTNPFIFWESSVGQSAHLWPQRHGSGGWPLLVEILLPSSTYQRDGGWHLPNAVFPFLMTITAKKKKKILGFTSLPWIAGFKRIVWVCCDARGEGTLGLLGVCGSHVSVLAWHLTVKISYSETYLREFFSEYGESWRSEFFAFQVSHAFWRARFDLWLRTGTTTLTNLTFPAFVLIPLVVVTLSGCNSSYGGLADSVTARHPPLLLLLSLHQYLGTEMLVLGSMCTMRFLESFTEVID